MDRPRRLTSIDKIDWLESTPDGAEIGVEQLTMVDLAHLQLRCHRVGCSKRAATGDLSTGHHHRPGLRPMVATVVLIDVRCSAKLAEHNHQCLLEQAALGQVVDEASEWTIELAQLLDVEVEILVVRVVVAVRHLHKRDFVFEQSSASRH